MDIHAIYRPISRYFRTRRMYKFAMDFGLHANSHVLDVGGSAFNWLLIPQRPRLTFLNMHIPQNADTTLNNCVYIVADARKLPFDSQSFDIAFSNSVIEHLGSFSAQQEMAQEIVRVGKQYYVQTPNKWFPVEPHFLAPCIHWLPKNVQVSLMRNFTLRGWVTRPDRDQARELVNEIRLLSEKEVCLLFPDGQIWRERLFGWTKSFVSVKL